MPVDLVKVHLEGPDGEMETLWAWPLGEHLFELHNTPIYAYGVAWHDVIAARAHTPDGFPVFVRVAKKSGFRTGRAIRAEAAKDSAALQAILDGLGELGCSEVGAK